MDYFKGIAKSIGELFDGKSIGFGDGLLNRLEYRLELGEGTVEECFDLYRDCAREEKGAVSLVTGRLQIPKTSFVR